MSMYDVFEQTVLCVINGNGLVKVLNVISELLLIDLFVFA